MKRSPLGRRGPTGLAAAVGAFFKTERVPELERLARAFAASPAPRVLVFGDSVTERIAHQDVDRRSLGELLVDALEPSLPGVCISHSAYHAGVFLDFTRAALAAPVPPSAVIVPVNLRSFSVQWCGRPRWQFEKEREAARRLAARPSKAVPRVRAHTIGAAAAERAFLATPISHEGSTLRSVKDFLQIIDAEPSSDDARLERLREIFAFHYMFTLRADHPRARELGELRRLVVESGCTVLFYSTPINHEAGTRLLGPRFRDRIRAHVSTLRTSLPDEPRASFLDLSEALGADEFFHDLEPTEHLAASGRARVASRVAEAMHGLDGR